MTDDSKTVKFVQIAVSEIEDSGDWNRTMLALDESGHVYRYYQHETHGWGWFRVTGDRIRRNP